MNSYKETIKGQRKKFVSKIYVETVTFHENDLNQKTGWRERKRPGDR